MILGVEISNIRRGGGITHIVNLLNNFNNENGKIEKIIVWGSTSVLEKINNNQWIEKRTNKFIELNFISRFFWQLFLLSDEAKKYKCDILFAPGGTFLGNFKPYVTMSQNMLPFDFTELKRFGFSILTIKFYLLSILQRITFNRSSGIIFLTNYAKEIIEKKITNKNVLLEIIPHGISDVFYNKIDTFRTVHQFTVENPCKIIYISIIDMYKHQWKVAEATIILKKRGYDIQLTFVGPYYAPALKKLNKVLVSNNSDSSHITYIGEISYEKLHLEIQKSDIYLFASSCENMPNILIEGMASGIPIVCSDKRPMTDILSDAGLYFNYENPESIANSIEKLINSHDLRKNLSNKAQLLSRQYSWNSCSEETFCFINKVFCQYYKPSI